MDRWLRHLAIFVLALLALRVFFRWPISILGSVVLSIIVSLVFTFINRR